MARTPKVVDDRRAHILEAALRVFAAKGFASATNKDIAAEASITPGLIYHYFPSKEELMRAILEQFSPVQGIRAVSPEMLDLPPETLLPIVVQNMLSIAESEPFLQLVRLSLPELIHNPALLPQGLSTLHEATMFLEHYLTVKMKQGELQQTDLALVVQVLMGSITGIVMRRHIFRDPLALQYTQEQIVESIVTTMLHGLLNH